MNGNSKIYPKLLSVISLLSALTCGPVAVGYAMVVLNYMPIEKYPIRDNWSGLAMLFCVVGLACGLRAGFCDFISRTGVILNAICLSFIAASMIHFWFFSIRR